ncbi:hypothetical protein DFP72DRAFT_1168674 [Ephemerocybe angulata]|uniref:DUF6533 domain-containing protein n=1 Tax=Ephemerocybe angulata TaxID=980116 RepID=A0A8H6I1J1_9AGAR|nr:hypothetical protein DFP72DRAFT_1168674 [Tulosesus angulatus]
MDPDAIQELVGELGVWRGQEYGQVAGYTALLYYYATSFDEEVERIWPQPPWKIGKVLYLLSRYSNILRIVIEIVRSFPIHATISTSACNSLQGAFWSLQVMALGFFPEAIFWLCIYALLGGKTKYLIVLAVTFLAFVIPTQVLQGMSTATVEAIELSPLESALGYTCSYAPSTQSPTLFLAAAYLALTRTTLIMVVAIITLFVRYRKQKNRLIKVIRREGAVYYLSAFLIGFVMSLSRTPGLTEKIVDKYDLLVTFKSFMIPAFADRLLLKMQKIDDLGTRALISTLVFEPRNNGGTGSTDSEGYYEEEGSSISGAPSPRDVTGDPQPSKDKRGRSEVV